MKIKQTKDKILNEFKEFDLMTGKKEKIDLNRMKEIANLIKSCGIKFEDKKFYLDRKI